MRIHQFHARPGQISQVWTPSILEKVANSKGGVAIKEALERVTFFGRNRYSYKPSPAYFRFVAKHAKRKAMIPIINEIT